VRPLPGSTGLKKPGVSPELTARRPHSSTDGSRRPTRSGVGLPSPERSNRSPRHDPETCRSALGTLTATTPAQAGSITGGFHSRLVYDLYGPSSTAFVVSLYGLLLDAELNRGIAPTLAERRDLIAPVDFLGHGRSDMPTHASTRSLDHSGREKG
jgi:hypothetical protein